MPRAAIVLCVALLLAAAGWWSFTQSDGPPLEPRLAEIAANASVAAGPAAAATAAIDAAAKPGAENVERTNASLDVPSEAPPLPADAAWVEVLVLDKATKEPVAGADVFWTDDTQRKLVQKLASRERDALLRDQDATAERFGWRARSDQAGKVRVTTNADGTRVMARAGTRFGETWLQRGGTPPADGHRVLLAEDVTLRARVLDHAGRPAAGVPLALLDVQPDGKLPQYNEGTVTSGDDGIATFKHAQQRRAQRGKPVEKWGVRVAIHKLDAAPVLVDAQSPPVEPVEVRLPPTGRLAVRLTFEGKQIPGMEWIGVRCGPLDEREGWNNVWMRNVDADGFARFPYVPLGQTFVVNASSRQGGGVWDLEVDGPRAVDQEVSRTLEIASDVVALAGRLLDGDGVPLAEQTVNTRFGSRDYNPGGSVTTDDAGRFLWIYTRVRPDQKQETKLDQLTFERQVENGSPQRVSVAPRPLAIGRNDLGDLRFAVGTLVVSGKFVFDSPGSQKASFVVERFADRPARGEPGLPPPGLSPAGRPDPNRQPDPGPQWRQVADLQLATQDDGAFEARGTVEAGRYRVRVYANNHLPVDPVEFVPGATDVRIQIRRGNELVVTCRLPDGVEGQRVLLDLTRPNAPRPVGNASSWRSRRYGGGGDPMAGQSGWGASESGKATYRWPALEPGTYTLHIGVSGFTEALSSVADVVVPQPEGGDPRLADLDLRPAIGTLRIRAKTPDGARSMIVVIPQPQPPEGPWQSMSVGEETVLPVPKRPLDLLVAAQGCRPVTLRAAVDVVDVTLEQWPKVDVRFTGLDALPPGASLRVSSRDPAATGKRPQIVSDSWMGNVDNLLQPSSGGTPVKDGVATLRCGDTPRKLSITLSVGDRGKALKKFSPDEIGPGAGITVQLSADEIRAVVEELQKPQPQKK